VDGWDALSRVHSCANAHLLEGDKLKAAVSDFKRSTGLAHRIRAGTACGYMALPCSNLCTIEAYNNTSEACPMGSCLLGFWKLTTNASKCLVGDFLGCKSTLRGATPPFASSITLFNTALKYVGHVTNAWLLSGTRGVLLVRILSERGPARSQWRSGCMWRPE
jgi:hypothetical protein